MIIKLALLANRDKFSGLHPYQILPPASGHSPKGVSWMHWEGILPLTSVIFLALGGIRGKQERLCRSF